MPKAMIDFEEELRKEEEENLREALYIKELLPTELKEVFSKTDILHVMDTIVDYYYESGILEDKGDDDEEVEIDLEEVAKSIHQRLMKEGFTRWTPEELFFIVQADLDFMEKTIDEDVQ